MKNPLTKPQNVSHVIWHLSATASAVVTVRSQWAPELQRHCLTKALGSVGARTPGTDARTSHQEHTPGRRSGK